MLNFKIAQRPYLFLSILLFLSFVIFKMKNNFKSLFNQTWDNFLVDSIFILYLIVSDLAVYVILLKKITYLSEEEQKKIDSVRILYSQLVVPGKILPSSPMFKKIMQDVKNIIPPKQNQYKVLLSRYIHKCLLFNFMILPLSFLLIALNGASQFEVICAMVGKVLLSCGLFNSLIHIHQYFKVKVIAQRKSIFNVIGMLFLSMNIYSLLQISVKIKSFEYFYIFVLSSSMLVFFLEKLNQTEIANKIKKMFFIYFK